jgi:hypothetical protein
VAGLPRVWRCLLAGLAMAACGLVLAGGAARAADPPAPASFTSLIVSRLQLMGLATTLPPYPSYADLQTLVGEAASGTSGGVNSGDYVDPYTGNPWDVTKLVTLASGNPTWYEQEAGATLLQRQLIDVVEMLGWRRVIGSSAELARVARDPDAAEACVADPSGNGQDPSQALVSDWVSNYQSALAGPPVDPSQDPNFGYSDSGVVGTAVVSDQASYVRDYVMRSTADFYLPQPDSPSAVPIPGVPIDGARVVVSVQAAGQSGQQPGAGPGTPASGWATGGGNLTMSLEAGTGSRFATDEWPLSGTPVGSVAPVESGSSDAGAASITLPIGELLSPGRSPASPLFVRRARIHVAAAEPPPDWPPAGVTPVSCAGWSRAWAITAQTLVYHEAFPPLTPTVAMVSGVVRDRTGATLAGVGIEAIGSGGGAVASYQETFTDRNGAYRFSLPPGTYLVRPSRGEPPGQAAGGTWVPLRCLPACRFSGNPGSATITLPNRGSTVFDLAYSIADLVAESLEVTEGVQADSWYSPAKVAVPGLPAPVGGGTYTGVPLVQGVPAVVRLYAYAAHGEGARPVSNVPARLLGFRRVGGTLVELGGSPLAPLAFDGRDTRLLRLGPSLPAARSQADGAYTFDLPQSWVEAGAELTLVGEVDPAVDGVRPIPDCCEAHTAFALQGIAPRKVIHTITITPVEVVYQFPGDAELITGPNLKFEWLRVEQVLPFPRGTLVIKPYPAAVVNVSRQVRALKQTYALNSPTLNGCVTTASACRNAFDDDVLKALAGLGLPHGRWNYIIGYVGADLGVTDKTGGSISALGRSVPARPLSGSAHELMHLLGFAHASAACGGGLAINGGVFDSWPPDQRGEIQGVGLDRTPGSSALGPYRIIAPNPPFSQYYDIMSYCNNGDDAETWISTRNWTRLVDLLTT